MQQIAGNMISFFFFSFVLYIFARYKHLYYSAYCYVCRISKFLRGRRLNGQPLNLVYTSVDDVITFLFFFFLLSDVLKCYLYQLNRSYFLMLAYCTIFYNFKRNKQLLLQFSNLYLYE